jgi:hypothetical protein
VGNHRAVVFDQTKTTRDQRGSTAKGATVASLITTGMAMPIAALFGLSYATDSHLAGIAPMAATSIFIDGTKDIIPTNDPQGEDRMKGALNGLYDQGHAYKSEKEIGGNYYVSYPRSFGVLTGLSDPMYDESRGLAKEAAIKAIIDARTQNGVDDPIYVVGFSQGANAASDVLQEVKKRGVPTENVTFVLVGNGARNDGGLWARLPAGVYVPFIGLSFGASTNPDPLGPKVIQISKQYDGASDVPKYVMNPLAWANTVMGFMSVHNGYYDDVDISDLDTDKNGEITDAEITAQQIKDPDKYIITKNGNITDIVIRNKVGDLPLTQPLLAMGVPREVVEALDPMLRAIIETAYDRPVDGGVYPSKPVLLDGMPGIDQWITDFKAIAAGMKQTEEKLDDLNQANLMQAKVAEDATAASTFAAPPAETPAPTPTSGAAAGKKVFVHPAGPSYTPPPTQNYVTVPTATAAPIPPPPATTAPAPLGTTGVEGGVAVTDPAAPAPAPKFVSGIPKAIQGTVGVVKGVVGAFIPKRKTTTTPAPSTPTTDPDPTTDPSPSDPGPAGSESESSGTENSGSDPGGSPAS